jgi:hypothetical protein
MATSSRLGCATEALKGRRSDSGLEGDAAWWGSTLSFWWWGGVTAMSSRMGYATIVRKGRRWGG